MRKFVLVLGFLLIGSVTIRSQTVDCPVGFVCLTQQAANETATKLGELIEARKVIAEFMAERKLTDVERATATRVIERLQKVIEMDDKIFERHNKLVGELYATIEKALETINKLMDRINKPKSGWDKFMDALVTVGKIAIGILLGSAL